MIPDDAFIGEMESFLIKAHMIGQDTTNKEVVGQADISLEVKNLGASLYAKNRA